MSQKVLGKGATFLTHTVDMSYSSLMRLVKLLKICLSTDEMRMQLVTVYGETGNDDSVACQCE